MTMTIAGLAREGGVGVETVRYYQRRGLLQTPARAGKVRRYNDQDVRRLRFIRGAQAGAQAAGFTLEQIGELLTLDSTGDRPRARALARARIVALDAEILRLQTTRNALKRLAKDCGDGPAGPCPILTAF